METLFQDIRFGTRRLWQSPGFTLIAVLSLALGIGANAAIFSLVNTVLLRPLPVADSGKLVSVSVLGKNDAIFAFSYPTYVDFRDRNEVLSGIYVSRFAPMSLSRNGNNERVWGYLVSGNYFDVLGVRPAQGRLFTQEEDRAKLASPVAVISYGCWQRRFGADLGLVGRDVIINDHPFKVIGVAPEGFHGTDIIYTPEIWVPIMMDPWIEPGSNWLDSRDTQNIFATGRLKAGVSRAQAEASLNILARQLGQEHPDSEEGKVIRLIPPGFIIPTLRGAVVSFTAVLMVTVVLVLLIACTNLASLLLARATDRRREIAIRLALGAGRMRLVRQLLTESVLLSIVGGVAGLLLAVWLVDLVIAFRPPIDFPLTFDLTTDWRVLAFASAVSLVTGIIFGLAPAMQSTHPELVPALKDMSSASGYRRSRLRSGLVVVQIALSLILLVAAGLVVRALQQLRTMNPGFQVENGLTMSFDLGLQGYDKARGHEFQKRLVENIRSLPGVKAAAVTGFVPLSLNYSSTQIYVEGQPPVRGANVPLAMYASVGLDYFTAMGIPLLGGRDFTEKDREGAPQVVVVNETFARQFFPGPNPARDAVGKRVSVDKSDGPFRQIAGVVKDGKYFNIGEDPRAFIYFPMLQSYDSQPNLIVRTSSDPQAMIAAIRGEVQKLDPNLPVFNVKTLAEHMGLSLFPARIAAALLGGFGLLALALAGVGIYGVTAYSVAQRTREIGIRMALGARPADVLRLIVRQGMTLAVTGLTIGLAVAVVLTRLMASVLYGVSATDVVTFVVISLLLTVIVLLACWLPARRAAKLDPMIALRWE